MMAGLGLALGGHVAHFALTGNRAFTVGNDTRRGVRVIQTARDSSQPVGKMPAAWEDPPSPKRDPGIRPPIRQREAANR